MQTLTHGRTVCRRMLLFAETLTPYDAAYITLLTQTDNPAMQRAAEKIGYFYLNGSDTIMHGQVELAKPISPLGFADDDFQERARTHRAVDLDPFDKTVFQDRLSI